jgi:hypothetical protein
MFTQLIAIASLATAALATPLASRYFYAPSNGTQLNYQGNTQQCLSVNNGYAAQGTDVELYVHPLSIYAPTLTAYCPVYRASARRTRPSRSSCGL